MKIIFIFLFASYLSVNTNLSLNVIKFSHLDIKNVTKANALLCVNTSVIKKGSNIYLSLESKNGSLNSEIYYKSVEKCPNTYNYKKGDNTFKSLKPTIQQVNQNKKKNFFYEYNIPKADDKIWYMVVYTGFKGKIMTVTFKPFSTSDFAIIILIVLGSIILIIVSIYICCCCCCNCCRTKGKGKIYQYDNSYKGDNLVYNTIN